MPHWNRLIRTFYQTPYGELEILLTARSYALRKGASIEVLKDGVYVAQAWENWETGKVLFEGKEQIVNWLKIICVSIDYYDRERITIRIKRTRKKK